VKRAVAGRIPRSFNALILIALVSLYGCSSTAPSDRIAPTPTLGGVAVTLSLTTASVQVSGTQAFTATVQNDSANKGVTWTLSGTGCSGATCGTVSPTSSASGAAMMYTAPASVPTPATVTLTATSVADGTKSAVATITVTAATAIAVTLSLTTASVQTGATQAFTAMVQNDSANKGVNWALSGAGCTSSTSLCGTLSAASSASGTAITYTAPAAVPTPATVTLTAASVADDTKFAVATITITAPASAIAVTLSVTTASVQVSATQAFTATVQNDSANKGVNWALSGAGCSGATCGTVSPASSASGAAVTYTAPASVPTPATVTLTATSVADGTKSASATITVTATSQITVTLSLTSASVPTGAKQAFTATVTNDPSNQGVTWTLLSSACSEGTCGSVSPTSSASGAAVTYTAPTSVPTPSSLTLRATSVADATKSASATITVTASNGGAVTVSLTPKRGGLSLSQSLNFTATVINDGAGVTWSATGSGCSGVTCGTFSAQTTATATYVAPATAAVITVTATSKADVTKSASATIGVSDLAGVTTYHNDLSRDGVNAQENALTTSNVASATFGKLFSCSVDGAVYAQPLWVPNLSIGGATHNVIFVATQHDSLYAFDADANPCVKLWQVSLIDTSHGGGGSETSVPSGPTGNLVGQGAGDITPEVGVTGTPVIDPSTNTLYVVSKSVIASGPTFFQRLHAIDITTGNEKFGGPAVISASISGTAPDAVSGQVTFNPRTENQRPGLALVNGVVYVAWASHEDADQYHGWIIGYNAASLNQVSGGVFNTTPNLIGTFPYSRGGIWMSGGAPAADSSNNLYAITGNGTYDGVTNFGDSLLKFSTSSGLTLSDWFTPSDQDTLNQNDWDFGAGGAALLVNAPSAPVPHLLIGGGKSGSGNFGEIFVLNRDALGNFNSTDSQVVQKFATNQEIFSTPAFWNNTLYVAPVGGNLMSYSFNGTSGLFNTSPSQSTAPSAGFGFPGATPSVSASGGANGILWALDNSLYCTPQSPMPTFCGPAVLHAYDATNLGTELWNSSQAANGRDNAGYAVKFTVPTVANGKVYVGTRGNDGTPGTTNVSGGIGELDVYGLLPN
jgi:hypothetical protein